MLEHRSIYFLQDVIPDMSPRVGIDAENVGVVGPMVNLAHSQPIRHHGFTLRVTISKDVRSVKQRDMA